MINQRKDLQSQIVIDFDYEQYPFLQLSENIPNFVKTTPRYQLTLENLEMLTSIHHTNMVNLKRIVKLYDSKSQKNKVKIKQQYSLYYEAVRRGLYTGKNLKSVLNKLINYLVKNQIYYVIRQKDIVEDQFGQIKIYIPFTYLIKLQKGNSKDVYNAINQLINSNKSQQSSNKNTIDNQLTQIKKQLLGKSQDKNKSNNNSKNNSKNYSKQQSSEASYKYQEYRNKIQKMRFSNLDKMIMPNPLRCIAWGEQKNRNLQNLRHSSFDKYQQNINCINIYHASNPKDYIMAKSPIKQSMPYIEQEYMPDSDSVDTYKRQIGQSRIMPKIPTTNLRHTVLPNTQRAPQFNTNIKKRYKGVQIGKSTLNKDHDSNNKKNKNKQALINNLHRKRNHIFEQQFQSDQGEDYQDYNTRVRNTFDHRVDTFNMLNIPNNKKLQEKNKKNDYQQRVKQAVEKSMLALQVLKKVKNITKKQ